MKTEIIYEDANVFVIYKPAGIATQSARIGQQDVVSELRNYVRQNEKKSGASGKGEPYLGVIHRLDQPVEGLLVFARNPKAAAGLTRQLQERQCSSALDARQQKTTSENASRLQQRGTASLERGKQQELTAKAGGLSQPEMIADTGRLQQQKLTASTGRLSQPEMTAGTGRLSQPEMTAGTGRPQQPKSQSQEPDAGFCKHYYAVLYGLPTEETGELENWLCKKDGRAEVTAHTPEARIARLRYSILQMLEPQGISLADIQLETGRFHQIRAQMANNGTPLLGDLKYGSEVSNALSGKLGIRNVALCAYRLEFIHPATGKKMHFQVKPKGTAFSFFSQL